MKMYFPDDMNFQYFFFDTYIGYFLQALPISLVVGVIYEIIRFRKDKSVSIKKKILLCIFVCYITGLICLVLGLDLMHIFWYNLFYHFDSSIEIDWFAGSFNLIPDFFNNINDEAIGNFLMFFPFGFLYLLSIDDATFKRSIIMGMRLVIFLELFQVVVGRAFDTNDIILNSLGIIISSGIFMGIKKIGDNLKSK